MILAWRNDPGVRRFMYSDHEIQADEHARWLASVLADPTCSYQIFECEGKPVGNVGFYALSKQHSRGEWNFHLGQSTYPRATGPAMEFFALDHFFRVIGLEKLCCEVLAFNERVTRLHERFGFQHEGLRRRHMRRSDGPHDVVQLALFAEDWQSSRDMHFQNLFQ